MNPIGTIAAFSLFWIGSGYLWVEGCIKIAGSHGLGRGPGAASMATRYALLFVAVVVFWLVWALYCERKAVTMPRRNFHVPVGMIGCTLLFAFYIYAGLSVFSNLDTGLSGG